MIKYRSSIRTPEGEISLVSGHLIQFLQGHVFGDAASVPVRVILLTAESGIDGRARRVRQIPGYGQPFLLSCEVGPERHGDLFLRPEMKLSDVMDDAAHIDAAEVPARVVIFHQGYPIDALVVTAGLSCGEFIFECILDLKVNSSISAARDGAGAFFKAFELRERAWYRPIAFLLNQTVLKQWPGSTRCRAELRDEPCRDILSGSVTVLSKEYRGLHAGTLVSVETGVKDVPIGAQITLDGLKMALRYTHSSEPLIVRHIGATGMEKLVVEEISCPRCAVLNCRAYDDQAATLDRFLAAWFDGSHADVRLLLESPTTAEAVRHATTEQGGKRLREAVFGLIGSAVLCPRESRGISETAKKIVTLQEFTNHKLPCQPHSEAEDFIQHLFFELTPEILRGQLHLYPELTLVAVAS